MFSTLRLSKDTRTVENAPKPLQQACISCRKRKLRCLGGSCCERCRTNGIPCVYPRPIKRKRHRPNEDATNFKEVLPVQPRPLLESNLVHSSRRGSHRDLDNTSMTTPQQTLDISGTTLGDTTTAPDTPINIGASDFNSLGTTFSPDYDFLFGPIPSFTPGNSKGAIETTRLQSPLQPDFSCVLGHLGDVERGELTNEENGLIRISEAQVDTPLPTTEIDRIQTTSASCQCLALVARYLETLSIEKANAHSKNVTRFLNVVKQVLNQTFPLIGCSSCMTLSHFVFLLIVLCKDMTACFQRINEILIDQYLRLQQHKADITTQNAVRDQTSVQNYDLDPIEAPCVIGALTLLQIKKLRQLLVTVQQVSRASGRDAHSGMMNDIDVEIKQQIRLYDKGVEALHPCPLEEEI